MVKFNSQTGRDLEDACITVELSIHNAADSCVCDRFETRPARRRGDIQVRSVDGDTVFGRIVLGLLVEQPLSADAVIRIISALQMAVAPPNH